MESIDDEQIILRRVPPTQSFLATCADRKGGGLRATSIAMATARDEDFLSCSLLSHTTPKQLLDQLQESGKDNNGWMVCMFLAKDVREAGFEIFYDPTSTDPGHCSISGEGGIAIPNKKLQKLAKRTRILTDEEIENPNQIA